MSDIVGYPVICWFMFICQHIYVDASNNLHLFTNCLILGICQGICQAPAGCFLHLPGPPCVSLSCSTPGIPPGRNMRIAMFLLLACWFGPLARRAEWRADGRGKPCPFYMNIEDCHGLYIIIHEVGITFVTSIMEWKRRLNTAEMFRQRSEKTNERRCLKILQHFDLRCLKMLASGNFSDSYGIVHLMDHIDDVPIKHGDCPLRTP